MKLVTVDVDGDCSIVTGSEERCQQDVPLDPWPDSCVVILQTYLFIRFGSSRACESPVVCDVFAYAVCQQDDAENGEECDQHIDEEVVADLIDASQTVSVG